MTTDIAQIEDGQVVYSQMHSEPKTFDKVTICHPDYGEVEYTAEKEDGELVIKQKPYTDG